jgi:hypothetical protein
MGAAVAALGIATCVLVLLMTSHVAPAIAEDTTTRLAQSDNVITARVTSATKADACSSSVDKAYNLCMINGMFNITRVTCDCIESGVRGAPTWECTGTAACQK